MSRTTATAIATTTSRPHTTDTAITQAGVLFAVEGVDVGVAWSDVVFPVLGASVTWQHQMRVNIHCVVKMKKNKIKDLLSF